LTDNHQLITNMDEHAYDVVVSRYAAAWNLPQPATGAVAMLPPPPSPPPTGRPTNADFPSAASTPPVSIMSPEPGTTPGRAGPPAAGAPKAAATPPAAPEAKPPPAAKKQAAKKPAAPTSIAPVAAPAGASNDDQ
jgi:hypothetical protein